MDFIDKQNDLALGGCDFLEHGLEPFLEFPPVFRTGDQGTHVQRNQLAILQGLGHIAVDDPLG